MFNWSSRFRVSQIWYPLIGGFSNRFVFVETQHLSLTHAQTLYIYIYATIEKIRKIREKLFG